MLKRVWLQKYYRRVSPSVSGSSVYTVVRCCISGNQWLLLRCQRLPSNQRHRLWCISELHKTVVVVNVTFGRLCTRQQHIMHIDLVIWKLVNPSLISARLIAYTERFVGWQTSAAFWNHCRRLNIRSHYHTQRGYGGRSRLSNANSPTT